MKISDLVVEGQDKDAKPTHKVTVTFSEPNNATVSKRNDISTQKATAQADDKDSAIERIKKHYTKAGYKVHDVKHDGLKEVAEGLKSMYHSAVAKHHGRKADAAFDDGDEEGFKKHMDKNISHKLKAGEKVAQVRDPKKFKQGVAEEVELEESDQLPIRKYSSFIHGGKKERLQSMQDKRDVITHIDQIAQKLKAKKEKEELGEEVEEEVDESSAHKLLANKLRNMYLLKKGAGDATRPAVVSTKKPIGSRVADIGPGGKEYNVKTDKAWDDTQKEETELEEEPATRELCQSSKPDDALGASQLSSCKSQGYRAHTGGKSHKIGSDRVHVNRKKIKGKKYGGPLPDWS